VLWVLNFEGDARLFAATGEGEEKISSFSTGIDLGLGWVGLSFALLDGELDNPPDGTRRKGDLLTYSFRARPFNPILCRGTRFPDRISGLSFSLLPETILSPDTLLSELDGAGLVRSADTLLVPVDDLPPLADLDAERDFAVAEIPSPILAFGVDATPTAEVGASPIPLLPALSWITLSSAEFSPGVALDCLNIELETSEFLVTCLKLELVLLGDASNPGDSPSDIPGDFSGDPSRLAIFRGDHPCAEELIIEFRAAFAGL
jgi:hypothetical protein